MKTPKFIERPEMYATFAPSIKQIRIIAPPDWYEAYQYKYTCLNTGMMYYGYHTGDIFDEYNHSSENPEFKKIFASPDSNLLYEILDYGTTNLMKNVECRFLTKVNAAHNPLYFNNWNGILEIEKIDKARVNEMVDSINRGDFNTPKLEKLTFLKKLQSLQVRDEVLDIENYTNIKNQILDSGGSIAICKPILIYEFSDVVHKIGNGNHTLHGAYLTGTVDSLHTARVPPKITNSFNETELREISSLLNAKKSDIVEKYQTIADSIKSILERYQKGHDVRCNENRIFLKELGHANADIDKKIFKKCESLIEKEDFSRAHRNWIHYKNLPYKREIENISKSYITETSHGSKMSSGNIRLGRIFDEIVMTIKMGKELTDYYLIVHHPNMKSKITWDNEDYDDTMKLFKLFLYDRVKNSHKINFHIIEMKTTLPNLAINQ